MARVTVEDCLEHVDNRFTLVRRATQRARQMHRGAQALVPDEEDKNTVIALREIAAGKVTDEILEAEEARIQQEEQEEAAMETPFGYGDDRDDEL